MKWFQGPTQTTRSEHIEDYAIRKIPSYYRWPIPAIIAVLLGNSTAMFFFTFGAQLSYVVGWLICCGRLAIFYRLDDHRYDDDPFSQQRRADHRFDDARHGLRLYGFCRYLFHLRNELCILFFLFEGTIVTHAISLYFHVEFDAVEGTLIFGALGLVKLLFVWYGMKALQIFQTWGVVIYALLLGLCLYQLTHHYQVAGPDRWVLPWLPEHSMWIAFMMANGQMVFQGLMAADYGRFAKENSGYRGGFLAMIGMLVPMFVTILIGPLFAYTLMPTITGGDAKMLAADSGYVFPKVIGIWGVLFVLVTQFRVNVMNLYSGSLALSNTFSLAFRFKPGRSFG